MLTEPHQMRHHRAMGLTILRMACFTAAAPQKPPGSSSRMAAVLLTLAQGRHTSLLWQPCGAHMHLRCGKHFSWTLHLQSCANQ